MRQLRLFVVLAACGILVACRAGETVPLARDPQVTLALQPDSRGLEFVATLVNSSPVSINLVQWLTASSIEVDGRVYPRGMVAWAGPSELRLGQRWELRFKLSEYVGVPSLQQTTHFTHQVALRSSNGQSNYVKF